MEGWICPRCGKALAPWVAECDCKPMNGVVYDNRSLVEPGAIGSPMQTYWLPRMCGNCDKHDSVVLPSDPPQYRCSLTGEIHYGAHICDLAGKDK